MSGASPDRNRLHIFSWTLFDFGNTAFSVIIVTVIYSTYFTDHVAGGQSWLWGLAVSLSMIVTAALAPPLGAAADYSRNRKLFLLLFTLVCILCTACMYFVTDGMILTGIILFILANVGFEGGLVFYDAFLPGLTTRERYGRISGYGFAMGYLGALAVLLIVSWYLPAPDHPAYLEYVRESFLIASGFFLVFSAPMFLIVPEPDQARSPVSNYITGGIRRSASTFRELFRHRPFIPVARFLIAFFIYNDGILTIIAFAAVFARHVLKMPLEDTIVFFAIVQTSAVAGSLLFGSLTDRMGPKKTLTITLILWTMIAIGAFFVRSVIAFYGVGLAAGVAIGSSQSASRTMMALLTPREHEAEYFGFYDGLCGKASAVIGPLVYGVIADVFNERVASLAIGVFFLAGLVILSGVREPARSSVTSGL